MKILVNGVGNIGTTLLQVIATHREALGVSTMWAHKATVQPWDLPQTRRLQDLGVQLLSPDSASFPSLENVSGDIGYVFDTTRAGGGLRNKDSYDRMPALVGASAQGTEKGFGPSFMLGFDIAVDQSRFVHIVSCNTHAALSVLTTLSDGDLDSIEAADFVMARRSDDIGNHERLVAGNVLARHLDPALGTHHAVDSDEVLRSVGARIPIQSSDITTPSQFLHATRFSIRLREEIGLAEVEARIERGRYVGRTAIFDSNKVFEIGRRFGVAGRLFNHVIFVPNNMLIKDRTITGWAFVPQEGNTILSTLAAFLRRTRTRDEADRALDAVAHSLLIPEI